MLTPWKENYDQPRQHIKKQRHYFANKGLSSQSYGFTSSHVWMWELDHKEAWAPKNWCFKTVVLEKARESLGYGGLIAKLCPTLATPWMVPCQDPLSMGFSRQEFWSGLSFPSLGDLPNPGIEPRSPAFQAEFLPTKLWGKLEKTLKSPFGLQGDQTSQS